MRSSRRLLIALSCGLTAVAFVAFWDFPEPRARYAHAKTDRSGLYDLARARTLSRVVGHIRANYVAPERVDVRRMVVAALARIQAEVPEVRCANLSGGAKAPSVADIVTVSVGEVTREFALDKLTDLYELNWKLMDIFDFLEHHLPPAVDLEAVEFAAVNGILSTLDPHSVLMAPRTYRELQLSQKGRFGGLGVSVGEVDGQLVVQQVMHGTPASEKGLEVDDRIVQIEGQSAVGMSLDEAVNLLRGEPGTDVSLWIVRAGWKESRVVKLTRREIQLPAVESEALGQGIGWVHIRAFQETTDEDLEAALERLERAPGGLTGLILDLRDNPGGLLDKAIKVSDLFLERGTIVTTVREGGRERDETFATTAGTRSGLPLVVLVNRGSASASEIVAGALKRNERALVLGQRTFGKGSVQVIYKIDDAALKLTIAQYLTPGDVSIQGVGIVPDVDIIPLRVPDGQTGPLDGRLDLSPLPETNGGEASLSAHLSSSRTREERPSVVLRMLEDLKTPTHRQRRGEGRVADGTVKLARDILLESHTPERKQALVQLAGFFLRRQEAEAARLEAALGPLGVDWRSGTPPPPKAVALSLRLPEKVTPGEPFDAVLELRNLTRRPYGRLHVQLQSPLVGVDQREVAFGLLEGQRTQSRTLRLNVPPGAVWGGHRVVAELHVDGQPLEVRAAQDLTVAPRPMPAFAHTVQVRDPDGNGDGLVQRGERVEVFVWIENVGRGAADALVATLRNESGPEVFIHAGRAELGPLGPGGLARARFELEVKPEMAPRMIELGLELSDSQTRTAPSVREVELGIFPGGREARVEAKRLVVLPNFATSLHAGASRDTPHVAEASAGAVLEAVGSIDGWTEVRWGREPLAKTGWLRSERLRIATDGGVTHDSVNMVHQYRPPVISIDEISSFNSGPELPMQGWARFSDQGTDRRLLYIFRARDKVFFRSIDPAQGAEPSAKGTPFQASIPLEIGPNEITVVAREGKDSVTRTTFSVVRLD
jgi:carboxyl-terminal processing protease